MGDVEARDSSALFEFCDWGCGCKGEGNKEGGK